jgi:hypothetical protein
MASAHAEARVQICGLISNCSSRLRFTERAAALSPEPLAGEWSAAADPTVDGAVWRCLDGSPPKTSRAAASSESGPNCLAQDGIGTQRRQRAETAARQMRTIP